MLDIRNEKAFIYRIALPVMQVIAFVLLFFALLFDDRYEGISDILRNTSIVIQILALSGLGVKQLLCKNNRLEAFLCFGGVIAVTFYIVYIINVYK